MFFHLFSEAIHDNALHSLIIQTLCCSEITQLPNFKKLPKNNKTLLVSYGTVVIFYRVFQQLNQV